MIGRHAAEVHPSRCDSYVTAETCSDLCMAPLPVQHRSNKFTQQSGIQLLHAVCARAGRHNFTAEGGENDVGQSPDIDAGDQTGQAGFLLGEHATVRNHPLT